MFNFVVTTAYGMDRQGVDYDLQKYPMIGAEPQAFMHMAGSGVDIGDDVFDIGETGTLTYGTPTRNTNTTAAEMLFQATDNPLKVVTGFEPTEDIIQSLASGELDR